MANLARSVGRDPEGRLGPRATGDVAAVLVKACQADEPLSLQAHPSAEQAVEGYLRKMNKHLVSTCPQLPRHQSQIELLRRRSRCWPDLGAARTD